MTAHEALWPGRVAQWRDVQQSGRREPDGGGGGQALSPAVLCWSMSETYRHILGLRAIRDYQERPIRQEDLDRVLEAARWTGSSRNLQKWAVVVIRDPDQIERLADCGDFTTPLRAAAVALALVREPNTREFDTGRMAQNIMLAADALGMSTCPITLHRTEDTARVLGLPPGWSCRYAIALGYPGLDARPSRHGGRKPPEEIFHQESFGQ